MTVMRMAVGMKKMKQAPEWHEEVRLAVEVDGTLVRRTEGLENLGTKIQLCPYATTCTSFPLISRIES